MTVPSCILLFGFIDKPKYDLSKIAIKEAKEDNKDRDTTDPISSMISGEKK